MRPEVVKIARDQYQHMIDDCVARAPIEACGYLGGHDGLITHCFPMVNHDHATDHFTFDPKEQFEVLKKARAAGIQLMGVYHSHPETPARLSAEDLRLFSDPHMQYWIVSLCEETPQVGVFRIQKATHQVDISVWSIVIT
ncbi:M67 family peptidase [bacterium]|nr:M67 family peptidase [bacterium]